MKKPIVIIAFFLFTIPTFSQWSIISNQGDGHLFFLNDTLGYGLQHKTTDGGVTWNSMPSGPSTYTYFTSADTGHVIYNTNTGPPTYKKSTDGGANWVDMSSGFSGKYGAYWFDFPTPNIGFVYKASVLHKTLNAGVLWDTLFYNPNFLIRSYDFADVLNGFMASAYVTGNHYLFRTTDGGDSWDSVKITFSASIPFLSHIQALNDKEIIAIVTDYGKSEILYSADRGNTWTQQFSSDSLLFYAMDFPTEDTGYIVGANYKQNADSGLVLKTTNKGVTWSIQKTSYSKIMFRVDFISGTKGWISGQFGDVLYTDNGGEDIPTGLPPIISISTNIFPNPSNGYLNVHFATEQSNAQITIYNLSGEKVMQLAFTNTTSESFRFDVSNGLYLVHIITDDGTEKIVKIVQK